MSDAGIQQHPVATQLHRYGYIAGRPYSRIDDYRIIGIAVFQILQNDANVVGVEDALTAADGRTGRHDADRSRRLQVTRHHRIVAGVDENLKAVFHQLFRGLERGDRIGQQGFDIAETFEFDPIGSRIAEIGQQFAGQTSVTHGVLGTEAAGCVRENGVSFQIEIIENVAALFIHEPFAADGHRRHLATAGGQAIAHRVVAGVLAGTGDESAAKSELADDERFIFRLHIDCPAADQGDNLDAIRRLQITFAVPRRGHDFAVDLDRNAATIVVEML